jgi:indolepyruvate ferredoxin oxidoreductase
MLPGTDTQGRPKKRQFGAWIGRLFGPLSKGKRLRGTPFDPFGYSAERRMERALIKQYEADMAEVLRDLTPDRMAPAIALAELPLQIRGFGPVKQANVNAAAKRREELLTAFRAGSAPFAQAAE